jgi:cyanate permease
VRTFVGYLLALACVVIAAAGYHLNPYQTTWAWLVFAVIGVGSATAIICYVDRPLQQAKPAVARLHQ